MNVTIELTTTDTKFIINNLYPLYLHDLSEIWGWMPNQYGVFEEDEIKTLAEQNNVFDSWWSKPSSLFPYLIRVEGIPAGFALVASPPYAPPGCNYYLNEFFVLRSYRGRGTAEIAARQVLNMHQGNWQLQTNPTETNRRVQAFWSKTIHNYTNGLYKEELIETKHDGMKICYKFRNGEQLHK